MHTDNDLIGSELPLTEAHRSILKPLVRMIIPPSEQYGVPGADDAEIMAGILAKARDHEAVITQGLNDLNDQSYRNHDKPFIDIDAAQRSALIGDLASNNTFIRIVTSITITAYYQDKRIIESLGMEARPPFPLGNELEQGDWSLLDPVKQREKFYRQV